MKTVLIVTTLVAMSLAAGMAFAQQQPQPGPNGPTAEDLELQLTEQALSNATHEFLAERAQSLLLRNEVGQKDREIENWKARAARPSVPPGAAETSHPPAPQPPAGAHPGDPVLPVPVPAPKP